MKYFNGLVPPESIEIFNGDSEALLQGLELRYSEPWRYYHTGLHIADLLDTLKNYSGQVGKVSVVGWAMLYHDAIYDPMSQVGHNEEMSARLAEGELLGHLSEKDIRLVGGYTLATVDHKSDSDDKDLDFFLDADLLILGSSQERYDQYANDIRREYSHVSEAIYRSGRLKVLEKLVQKGIFRTEIFKASYESLAQDNIAREIKKLTS